MACAEGSRQLILWLVRPMNRALRVLLATVLLSALARAEPAAPRPGQVRAIFVTKWKEERSDNPLDRVAASYFDTHVPLADIPEGATARDVEALAARRAGHRGAVDWTVGFEIFRRDPATGRFISVGRPGRGERSRSAIAQLHDGDVLLYSGGGYL